MFKVNPRFEEGGGFQVRRQRVGGYFTTPQKKAIAYMVALAIVGTMIYVVVRISANTVPEDQRQYRFKVGVDDEE